MIGPANFKDRRYDAAPVLDDEAAIGRMRFINAHGVKEGLVKKCRQWPGFSSLPELVDGVKRSYIWPKSEPSNLNNITRLKTDSSNKKGQAISYPLRISPLPCFKDCPKTQRMMVKRQVIEIEAEHIKLRAGKAVLGREKVLSQNPHDKTINTKNNRRPVCHASTKEAIDKYKAEYEEFATKYAQASEQYRKAIQNQETEVVAEFPDYSFRPPIIGLVVTARYSVTHNTA